VPLRFTELNFFYGDCIKKTDLGGVCTMHGEKEMPAKFHPAK
jgi:hypothetical protein